MVNVMLSSIRNYLLDFHQGSKNVAQMLKFPRKDEGNRKKKRKEGENKGKKGRKGKERWRER